MGIGLSVFLIAVGAILRFAVHASVNGITIHTVGVILMIAGGLGLALTLAIFAPRRRATYVADRAVTADPALVRTPVVTADPLVAGRTATRETVARERVVESQDVY
jgi:hypothetical protein